jgi:hypothetical protein
MIAVADASPVCYLILIGEIEILPQLLGRILLPSEVLNELLASGAPHNVRSWAAAPPHWVSVGTAPSASVAGLERLHAGERAAILLAESAKADLVVLDDKHARRIASERGLRVAGLLGLLVEAANRKLLDLPSAIERLAKTSFRCSPILLRSLLEHFERGSDERHKGTV